MPTPPTLPSSDEETHWSSSESSVDNEEHSHEQTPHAGGPAHTAQLPSPHMVHAAEEGAEGEAQAASDHHPPPDEDPADVIEDFLNALRNRDHLEGDHLDLMQQPGPTPWTKEEEDEAIDMAKDAEAKEQQAQEEGRCLQLAEDERQLRQEAAEEEALQQDRQEDLDAQELYLQHLINDFYEQEQNDQTSGDHEPLAAEFNDDLEIHFGERRTSVTEEPRCTGTLGDPRLEGATQQTGGPSDAANANVPSLGRDQPGTSRNAGSST